MPEFSEVRDAIKSLHMRAYFDKPSTLGLHIRRAMNYAKEEYKEAINTEMMIYKKAVEIAEGGHLYDNEIFFHESCIYMDVLYELLNLDFFVWQCYDAFYAKKNNVEQEEFENLVSKLVAEKANNYIKG